MNTVDILESQIDKTIRDLLDLDMRIARSSGNVSVGFKQLKEMSVTLKANAARAIHSPKVTNRDIAIHNAVVQCGKSIKATAKEYGCSPSTIRRSMDKVTENDMLVARS